MELSFPTHYMVIYKTIHVYYINKSPDSFKKLCDYNMDSLFNCHIVGWKKIATNWFGVENFPL